MNNDNKYGDFLIREKLATNEDIEKGVALQRQTLTPIGKVAVNAGYLTRRENINLLVEQKETGLRYGDLAMRNGLLTKEEIEQVLELKKGESVTLGKVLVSIGVLTRKENVKALVKFHAF